MSLKRGDVNPKLRLRRKNHSWNLKEKHIRQKGNHESAKKGGGPRNGIIFNQGESLMHDGIGKYYSTCGVWVPSGEGKISTK